MRSLPERFKISAAVKKHHSDKRGGPNTSINARFDLQHRLWRDAVMTRDKGICQICKNPAQVVHHLIGYHENPSLRYVTQNGQALCRACHARLHWNHEAMATSRARAKEVREIRAKLADARKYLDLIMQNPRFSHQNQTPPS